MVLELGWWTGQILQRRWTLIMAIGAIFLRVAPIDFSRLELTRHGLSGGELWSVFTGPFLHVSFEHFLFDLLGLLIVGWVVEPLLNRGLPAVAAFICVAVAVGAFAIYPDLDSYRGLSALDQGLLAAGAAALACRRRWRPALFISVVLIGKWTCEVLAIGSLMGTVSNDASAYGRPVPWCHVVGGLAGAASAAAWLWLRSSAHAVSGWQRLPCARRGTISA